MEDIMQRPEEMVSQAKSLEETPSSSNISDVVPMGMTFTSWNSFAEWYELFLNNSCHPIFVIRDSRTAEYHNHKYPRSAIPLSCGYKYAVFCCAHGRTYKSYSKGIRPNQNTQRQNCNAMLFINYLRIQRIFKITKCNLNHTNNNGVIVHGVSRDLYQMYSAQVGFRGINYTIARLIECNNGWQFSKEKQEAKDKIEKTELLLKYGTKMQNCRLHFKSETGIPISTKTLTNKKYKMQSKDMTNVLNNDIFLNELCKDENSGEIITEKVVHNNEIQLIYFQFQWMKEIFAKYPEHLLMDGTYSLVETRMPLYTIMIVDGNNNSVPVAFGLMSQETNYLLDYFLSFFVKHNPKSTDGVKSYMTDKDLKEMTVLAKYFPAAKHELCLFHVLKSMKNMVNSSDMPKGSKERAKTLLEEMVFSNSNEQFETVAEQFGTMFEGHQLKTDFYNRWYPIKELWAGYLRQETLNFGDTTNNRIESFNQKLKTYIARYSSMDKFYKNLKLFMSHLKEKLQKACFNEQSKQSYNAVSHIDKEIEDIINETATHYAGKILKEELLKSSEVKSAEFNSKLNGFKVLGRSGKTYFTKLNCCSCPEYLMRRIPCRHIFFVRANSKKKAFESHLLPLRWTKSYFVNACNKAFKSVTKQKSIVKAKENVTRYVPPNAECEKFLIAKKLFSTLTEILKTSGDLKFTQRVNILHHLCSMWSNNKVNDQINLMTHPKSSKEIVKGVEVINDDNLSKTSESLKETIATTPSKTPSHISSTKDVLPTAIKVCGRPKGSHLTAIGKVRKAPKPSERKKKIIQTALSTRQAISLANTAADITVQPIKADFYEKTATANKNIQPLKADLYDEQQAANINDQQLWVKIDKYHLYTYHKQWLRGCSWLDDMIINSTQSILRREHGNTIQGLQNCLLAQMNPPQFDVINGPFVQICNVNNSHWICIAGFIDPKDKHVVVDIYDSMSKGEHIYPEVVSIASSLTRHILNQIIEVRHHNMSQQKNGSDCGIYAIAFAKYVCMGVNPCYLEIIPTRLRAHLYECLEQYSSNSKTLLPFPAKPNIRKQCVKSSTLINKVYCKCRKPADDVMILCVTCKEQFHHNCIQVKVENPYNCERCKALPKKIKK